ncbi:MAG: alpha/beta hydrolase [Pseudomonadales bacterium]
MLLASLLAAAVATAAATPATAPVDFSPCELRGSGGQGRVDARCATIDVPEDPEDPDGASVNLFVARIPSLAPEAAADAVTIINGGPGASSAALYVDFEPAFAGLRRERDIILVDQRGTGRSSALVCPNLEAATVDFDEDLVRAATRACLDGLHHDPRQFTTSVAVTDLERLRVRLGYRAWNLYGVSYGTRVAQHYLRRYPQAVRSVVLDGVVPPGLTLGPDVALNAQAALDDILRRCREAAYCAGAFPDPGAQLQRLGARLREDPVELEVPDPVTGRQRTLTLHYAHLAMTLRLLSYAPETAALIPLIIDEAEARRNYLPLAAQALRIERDLEQAISFGMHNSVVCTEDVPFYAGLETLWPQLERTYLGGDQVRALQTICAIWPRGVRDPDFDAPLTAASPVLLLSGEHDPITPPEYAERAARSLPASLQVVAPGQGHGVIARGCVPNLVADFIDSGSLENLDSACVERLAADPFFVDLLGPPP